MKVLVTGAGGFLGREIVAHAVAAGHDVTAMVRPHAAPQASDMFDPSVCVVSGDLRSRGEWSDVLGRIDVVIHAAAAAGGSRAQQLSNTVVATEGLLEALGESRPTRFVHVSSLSVYDFRAARSFLDEQAPLEPRPHERDAYTEAKLVQERLVRSWCEARGVPCVIVRPGAIVGPGKTWGYGAAFGVGGFAFVVAPRAPFRLVSLSNAADAIVRAADADVNGTEVVNLVDDGPPTNGEYFRRCVQAGAPARTLVPVPWLLVATVGTLLRAVNRGVFGGRLRTPELLDRRRQEARWKPLAYPNEKAHRILGWRSTESTDEAVRRAVNATPVVRCLTVSALGGMEVYFRTLQSEFAAGDRVDITGSVWLVHEPSERLSRIPPLSLHWALAAWWSTCRQLRDLRRRGVNGDVVFFNHVSAVVLLGRLPRSKPVVLNLDSTPLLTATMSDYYLGRGARPKLIERCKLSLYRAVYRRVTHFVASSRLVERSLVDDYGVDPARITVIPLGIDVRSWTKVVDATTDDATVRILFVGAEFERKGGLLLLDTARLPQFSTFEFHIVTKSSLTDVPPNVIVHRDLDPRTGALRDLFAKASVFVLPTIADFSPIAICEAMAMELPVIATAVGAIDELVADGDNGFLVPVGDADAFRERLLELAGNPDLRQRMGQRGRAIVERSFDIEKNAERIAAVLHSARQRER